MGGLDPVAAVVLADTHLHVASAAAPRRWLPPAAEPYLEAADLILHAGDVLDAGVLERLGDYAPVHAVLGNNDRDLVGQLPHTLEIEVAGVTVGMIHDSGATAGRARRLRRRFPSADVVVFGHSHAPVNEMGEDGQLLFNPGSPTQRRAQPHHTLGRLILDQGNVIDAAIFELT